MAKEQLSAGPDTKPAPVVAGVTSPNERLVYVLEVAGGGGSDMVRLRQMLSAAWGGRWLILGCLALCVALAILYHSSATRWYEARVTLLPAESKSAAGLGSQVSGLGGVLGIGGLLNNGTKPEPLAVLRSRDFSARFIAEAGLAPILRERMPRSLISRKVSSDPRAVITYFTSAILAITEDRRNGVVDLQVTWTDPVLAAEWANSLAQRINAELRASALSEAESNIGYLREQMAGSSQVVIQQALGQLMQEQLENLLLARGNDEFAFKVIDPAYPPLDAARPQLLKLLAMAIALGSVLSVAVVLYRSRNLFSLN